MTATTTRKPRAKRMTPEQAADIFERGEGFEFSPVRTQNLHAMRRARLAVERAQADLDATVLGARETGSTLFEVGMALGISQQAASKRYARKA